MAESQSTEIVSLLDSDEMDDQGDDERAVCEKLAQDDPHGTNQTVSPADELGALQQASLNIPAKDLSPPCPTVPSVQVAVAAEVNGMQDESSSRKRPGDPENVPALTQKHYRHDSELLSELSVDEELEDETASSGIVEAQDDSTVCTANAESSKTPAPRQQRKSKEKFLLKEYLPKKVAAASHSKPDELRATLLQALQQKFDSSFFPEELGLVDLRLLTAEYASPLKNSQSSLGQILQTCMTELTKKGVTKVEKILFPEVEISSMASLLSASLSQNISMSSIEIPMEATRENLVADNIPDIAVALKPFEVQTILFVSSSDSFDGLHINSNSWKSLQNKTVERYLQQETIPTIKFRRWKLLGPNFKRRSPKALPKAKELPKRSGKGKESKTQIFFTTDGFLVPLQEVHSNVITAYEYWDLKSIHELGYKGKDTIVAIVDTGVGSHTAFGLSNSKIISRRNFAEQSLDCTTDPHGHGTFCANIVCGNGFSAYKAIDTHNSQQVNVLPGVAPEAKLVICKVTRGDESEVQPNAVKNALTFIKNNFTGEDANQKVDVVSLSFAHRKYSKDIADAVSDLVCAGVIVVCAASNEGHRYQTPICYPARLGNVLCIGSHGTHGKSSFFSPVGQDLDFLAPGENIIGADVKVSNQATCGSGTSFAAPAVAGLVCLIIECLKHNYPKDAAQFHNHWVMKELLREMSTNGGTHSNDRGFGTLRPIRFFRNPALVVENIHMDVLD